MDIAFVQYSEHDINDGDGNNQQNPQVRQGTLESLGCALEGGAERRRQLTLDDSLNLVHDISQRNAGLNVERDGDGWELSEVIDGLRAGFLTQMCDRIQWNQPPLGRLEVK